MLEKCHLSNTSRWNHITFFPAVIVSLVGVITRFVALPIRCIFVINRCLEASPATQVVEYDAHSTDVLDNNKPKHVQLHCMYDVKGSVWFGHMI